jgi:hypothetical protein
LFFGPSESSAARYTESYAEFDSTGIALVFRCLVDRCQKVLEHRFAILAVALYNLLLDRAVGPRFDQRLEDGADRNLGVSGEASYGQADDDKKRKNATRQSERDEARINGKPVPATNTPSAFEHGAENVKTLRHVYANKTNAQRGVANFAITLARGRPEIIPDQPAIVSGFKSSIDNTDWILTKVTHTLDDGGFTTALELKIKATEIPD